MGVRRGRRRCLPSLEYVPICKNSGGGGRGRGALVEVDWACQSLTWMCDGSDSRAIAVCALGV